MKFRNSRAFALPAVLISSIVMLIVMLSAVTSTVAVRVSLDSQYYNMLARNAGDAGTAYAKACLAANGNVAKWSDAKPLMPNTDCSGNQLAGFTCTAVNQLTEPRCSVSIADGNTIASFSVPAPSVDSGGKAIGTKSVGNIKRVRSSSSDVWRQYSASTKRASFSVGTDSSVRWKQISAGQTQTCAIASDDKTYCWGQNDNYYQLGNGTANNSYVPTAVSMTGVLSGRTFKYVSAGDTNTCAIADNDKVYCWGSNRYGEAGIGSGSGGVDMTGVLSGKTIKTLSTGSYHDCVIASDDKAYCWGFGSVGQVGDGNGATVNDAPRAVDTTGLLSGKTIKSISAGYAHTCAIASDDKAYCWGQNNMGQLGNNLTSNAYTPVAVIMNGALSGKTLKSISAGYSHTCAIASDDKAYCWGVGGNGILGDGLGVDSHVPVAVNMGAVLNGKTLKSISAGRFHTCVIASDDNSYCWGAGFYGQLGNGATADSNAPVAVNTSGLLSGKTIKSISGGFYYTCAIASDDNAYCWGNNNNGVLGNGTTVQSNVAAQVVNRMSSLPSTVLKYLYY